MWFAAYCCLVFNTPPSRPLKRRTPQLPFLLWVPGWPLLAPPGQLGSADCDERYLMDQSRVLSCTCYKINLKVQPCSAEEDCLTHVRNLRLWLLLGLSDLM